MGFTTAAVYPDSGELRGSGTVIALADEDAHVRTYRERSAARDQAEPVVVEEIGERQRSRLVGRIGIGGKQLRDTDAKPHRLPRRNGTDKRNRALEHDVEADA